MFLVFCWWSLLVLALKRVVQLGLELTEPRVEHVERHPIALLSASDRDETLVVAVLWFIDLDHAATDLTDLVDLLAALSDDGTDHVVGDVDLLGERSARNRRAGGHGLSVGTSRAMRTSGAGRVRLGVRAGPIAAGGLSAVGHLDCRVRVSLLGVAVLRRIPLGGHVMGSGIRTIAVVVLPIAKVATGRLGVVWNHLHSARDGSGGAAAAGRVGRGRCATKPLVKLFEECAANIVSCNVDSISHTHDDQRALRGEREARVGRIQAGAGCFLDLLDASAALSNDGADQDVRNQQTKGVCLGILARGLAQRLVVEGPDDQTERLQLMLA